MQTKHLDRVLARLTAFDSVEQLQRHVREGGKAPSFHKHKVAGVALADALASQGVHCQVWS